MTAAELLQQCEILGVKVAVQNGELVARKADRLPGELRLDLRARRAEVIPLLGPPSGWAFLVPNSIAREPIWIITDERAFDLPHVRHSGFPILRVDEMPPIGDIEDWRAWCEIKRAFPRGVLHSATTHPGTDREIAWKRGGRDG